MYKNSSLAKAWDPYTLCFNFSTTIICWFLLARLCPTALDHHDAMLEEDVVFNQYNTRYLSVNQLHSSVSLTRMNQMQTSVVDAGNAVCCGEGRVIGRKI